jgi:hypothetical protein
MAATSSSPMSTGSPKELSAKTGAYLLDGLRTLMRHKLVGNVRGKGLQLGVELVKDRTTKQPLRPAQITAIVEFCRDNGVIVGRGGGGRRYGNTVTMSPPLVITRAECDRSLDSGSSVGNAGPGLNSTRLPSSGHDQALFGWFSRPPSETTVDVSDTTQLRGRNPHRGSGPHHLRSAGRPHRHETHAGGVPRASGRGDAAVRHPGT